MPVWIQENRVPGSPKEWEPSVCHVCLCQFIRACQGRKKSLSCLVRGYCALLQVRRAYSVKKAGGSWQYLPTPRIILPPFQSIPVFRGFIQSFLSISHSPLCEQTLRNGPRANITTLPYPTPLRSWYGWFLRWRSPSNHIVLLSNLSILFIRGPIDPLLCYALWGLSYFSTIPCVWTWLPIVNLL